MFSVRVSAQHQTWLVHRTYEDFQGLDRQIHRCIFDRRFSRLPLLPDESKNSQRIHGYIEETVERLKRYLGRLCPLAGSRINCGPILNWFEVDSKGRHLQLTSKSGINVPAIAAARVVQSYVAQDDDELSLNVNEIVSIIDMPPESESSWWRGKSDFKVGFFPSSHVEVIGDKTTHENTAGTLRLISRNRSSGNMKPVLEKRGKMLSLLRVVMKGRPSKEELQRSGIVRSRVFGADLGEHLENSQRSVPLVVERCTKMIEKYGIVEGVYRLPGISSNVNRLRQSFDAHEDPNLEVDQYLGDIQCLASLCKMYFRELPNPLFTYQLYDTFEAACRMEEGTLKQQNAIATVLGQLPPPHLSTTEFLMKHLARLALHSDETKMTAKNLSIVWAPNLMKPQSSSIGDVGMIDISSPSVVVRSLITNVDWYFGEPGLAAMAASANIQIPPLVRSATQNPPDGFLSLRSNRGNLTPPSERRSKTTDDISSRKTSTNWRNLLSFGRKSVRSSYLGKGRPVISNPVAFVGAPPAAVRDAKDLLDAGPSNVSSRKSATLPQRQSSRYETRSLDEIEEMRTKRHTSPVADAFSGAFSRGSMTLQRGESQEMPSVGTTGSYRHVDDYDEYEEEEEEEEFPHVDVFGSPKVTSIDSPGFSPSGHGVGSPTSPVQTKSNSLASRVHSTDIDSFMASMLDSSTTGARRAHSYGHDASMVADGVEYSIL
ncbi:rho GTPase-activating protein 32-like isoform X2 [Corticium candelabrum]|nr:rho GTPase-activating protein 32-like isoform X2 [Corticium candelabrum]